MSMLGEAKVMVTVTSDTGEVWTYDVPRVTDFEVNVEKEPDFRLPTLRILQEQRVKSLKFSMRPLPDDTTGQYMGLNIKTVEGE